MYQRCGSFTRRLVMWIYYWVRDETGKKRRESLKLIKYILVDEERKYWMTNDWILEEFLEKDICLSWSVVMYLCNFWRQSYWDRCSSSKIILYSALSFIDTLVIFSIFITIFFSLKKCKDTVFFVAHVDLRTIWEPICA